MSQNFLTLVLSACSSVRTDVCGCRQDIEADAFVHRPVANCAPVGLRVSGACADRRLWRFMRLKDGTKNAIDRRERSHSFVRDETQRALTGYAKNVHHQTLPEIKEFSTSGDVRYFGRAVQRPGSVKAIQIHDLGPGCYKISNKLAAGIILSVKL